MRSHSKVRRLTTLAILSAMALAVQWFESFLPPIVPAVPVKLGLANIFTLYTMLCLSRREALAVAMLRCLLFPLVSGAVSGFFYASAGSLLSWAIMAALLSLVHRSLLSPMGLSVAGAFCFNLGQALVGFVTVGRAMLAYFPYMGLLSIPAGLATGFLCMLLMRRLAAREAPAKTQA